MVAMGLALVLAAGTPDESLSLAKIERRAAILSAVGLSFAVAGAGGMGVGVAAKEPLYTAGGTALIAVGLHAIALAVVAWLWPDDAWLGLLTDQVVPAGTQTWWHGG